MTIFRRLIALCAAFILAVTALPAWSARKQEAGSAFRDYQRALDQKQLWIAPEVGREFAADFVARLEKLGRQGDAKAQATLGLSYHVGRPVRRDPAKAAEWYRKAADQGHAGAQNNLGMLYDDGAGVERDAAKAHALYLEAAQKEFSEAQFNLGLNFATGTAVTQDWKEAAVWYGKAVAQGHLGAANNLGNIHRAGRGVPVDMAAAEKLLRKPAEAGLAVSQQGLASALANQGKFAEAAQWLRRSAEGGYVPGQVAWATALLGIEGVERDLKEALKWARKAADTGNAEGQGMVARVLIEDEKASPEEVARWARLAADHGSAQGQNVLGLCYHRGLGVERDLAKAVSWYRRAAEANEPTAAMNLAVLVEAGHGTTRDFAEAAKWYRVAAEGGNGAAQYRLGLFYRDGTGVDTDLAEAAKWLKLALKQTEDREARAALADVERLMAKAPQLDAERAFRRGIELAQEGERGENTFPEAAAYFEKAAATGHIHAQVILAAMFRRGQGVARDEAKADALTAAAAKSSDPTILCTIGMGYLDRGEQTPAAAVVRAQSYLRRAAVQGYPPAQNSLGYSLMSGEGQRDLVEACQWLTLASRQGLPEAKANLERLRPSLTGAQMADAVRRADEFKPAAK